MAPGPRSHLSGDRPGRERLGQLRVRAAADQVQRELPRPRRVPRRPGQARTPGTCRGVSDKRSDLPWVSLVQRQAEGANGGGDEGREDGGGRRGAATLRLSPAWVPGHHFATRGGRTLRLSPAWVPPNHFATRTIRLTRLRDALASIYDPNASRPTPPANVRAAKWSRHVPCQSSRSGRPHWSC
jgi:hypothetical protein